MLASCGKKNKEITISSYDNTNGFITQTSEIAESEKGYYVLSGRKTSDRFITFLDKETNEEVVLCSKINCNHTIYEVPKECDSYVGNVMLGSIHYYAGYIYYIVRDDSTYGCAIMRISENGSEHEMVCKLSPAPENASDYYSYVVTDKYVIYSESIYKLNKKNTAKIKLFDREDKTVEDIHSYEDYYAQLFDLKMDGDYLIFRQADSNVLESQLYALNIITGKCELISEKICSYTLKDGKVVYWKACDGIYEYDINSKKASSIYNSDNDTMYGFIASTDTNYYVFNMPNTRYNEDSKDFVGILKDKKIISKLYIKGELNTVIPLYIGSDRVLMKVFGNNTFSLGYSFVQNDNINKEIVISDILGK